MAIASMPTHSAGLRAGCSDVPRAARRLAQRLLRIVGRTHRRSAQATQWSWCRAARPRRLGRQLVPPPQPLADAGGARRRRWGRGRGAPSCHTRVHGAPLQRASSGLREGGGSRSVSVSETRALDRQPVPLGLGSGRARARHPSPRKGAALPRGRAPTRRVAASTFGRTRTALAVGLNFVAALSSRWCVTRSPAPATTCSKSRIVQRWMLGVCRARRCGLVPDTLSGRNC